MRRWIAIVACWSVGALTIPSNAWAGKTGSAQSSRAAFASAEAAAIAGILAHADSLASVGDFSGALLLARDEERLLGRAYGMADRDANRPNRLDTKFNLGSINKFFTRVAVLQLSERGKLDLDGTIDRYLPEYPSEKGAKITVRMLLEHRAGTGDFFDERYLAARDGLRNIGAYYDLVRDRPLAFEPGTRHEYSNAGYVILGAIIERLSGQDYYGYIRDHVYRPAGMHASASYALADATPNRAVGYTQQTIEDEDVADPEFHPNVDFLPARGSSAGGGYSTCEDMAAFIGALRAGRLLRPRATLELMGKEEGLRLAGGAPGVNAVVNVVGPYTLIVLANQDPPAAERVARHARERVAALIRAALDPDGQETDGPVIAKRRPDHDDPIARPKRAFVPPEGIDVPMILMTGHLPAVDVMVNGKGPYRFAVDTGGADALRVNAALARELGMKIVGETWAGDPSGKNRQRRDLVAVDSVQLGNATFVRMDAAAREAAREGLAGVDGILGFGFFSGYTVTFDYPGESLRVETKDLPPPNGGDILPYTDEGGVPSVIIRIASLEIPAHVDAGSMGGFVLPERVMGQLPLAEEPRVDGLARTATNTFELKGAPLRGTLRIGSAEFANPRLQFQPILPDAHVGSRVLRDFRVSFDTRNKRVRFLRMR